MPKCEDCEHETSGKGEDNYTGKFYVIKNKLVCEDCLLDMGVSSDEAAPYERS